MGGVSCPVRPADRIRTIALVPRVEGRRAVIRVIGPDVILEEGQLRGDDPAWAVAGVRTIFAEDAPGAARRPGAVIAAHDIRWMEGNGVMGNRHVLRPPRAPVPPVLGRSARYFPGVIGGIDRCGW